MRERDLRDRSIPTIWDRCIIQLPRLGLTSLAVTLYDEYRVLGNLLCNFKGFILCE